MECLRCGKWAPADKESGYDVDHLCGVCAAEGFYIDSAGDLAHENESDDAYFDRLDDEQGDW